MTDTKEIWRNIIDYEGLYQVSNLGRVKSMARIAIRIDHGKQSDYPVRERVLSPLICGGYYSVVLCKNGQHLRIGVHRLVARAFPEICGEWFEGAIVNHKDENPSNNAATNLETCTIGYNDRYGTRLSKISEKHKKPVIQLSMEGVFIKKWDSIGEAEISLGIHNISICCTGKRKSASGFIWKYA